MKRCPKLGITSRHESVDMVTRRSSRLSSAQPYEVGRYRTMRVQATSMEPYIPRSTLPGNQLTFRRRLGPKAQSSEVPCPMACCVRAACCLQLAACPGPDPSMHAININACLDEVTV